MARGEAITTKIHSRTNVIPPMFHFITSNRQLNDHKFKERARNTVKFNTTHESCVGPSKNISQEDINAVRNRYIEAFVRQRPVIPASALPACGSFNQRHMIIGLFRQIIKILSGYEKEQFVSDYLYLYPICGLAKNVHLMPEHAQQILTKAIRTLMDKYQLDSYQRFMCWSNEDDL
jgi:hypothetical protein